MQDSGSYGLTSFKEGSSDRIILETIDDLKSMTLGNLICLVAHENSHGEVALSSFTQLGVTRRDQVARMMSSVPGGYDAVEAIGMLKGLALHVEARAACTPIDEGARADCHTGTGRASSKR